MPGMAAKPEPNPHPSPLWDAASDYIGVVLRDVEVEAHVGLHPWEQHPERPSRLLVTVEMFAHLAAVTIRNKDVFEGEQRKAATEKALQTWLDGVRDDARWADTKHAGSGAFADHAMRTIHVDKRRAAGRFLRGVRSLFPNAPGADVLRAAESYGYSADAATKIGAGPFDGSVAMRFLDIGHRRAWAKALEAILAHEREANDALASAEGAIR